MRAEIDGISDPGGALDSRMVDPPNGGPSQWFALVVKPRFDKAVARALAVKGYETLLPVYKKYHKYGERSRHFELPLFPGYVCCRFDVRTMLPILTTPGVIRVLGARNMPTPLSDAEIHSLQRAIEAQLPVEPFPYVDTGQKVRITSGVLAGVEGIVLKSKPSLRLVLSITLLQRSILLEIGRSQVSPEEVPSWTDAGS
ncbi:MAG TPA: transcription termination/antitermination NusG family protein [Bryobacteraceae bacterium]|nr:transcription termination/antitermination NusG family protein [Bryobacteraceae bacterium]